MNRALLLVTAAIAALLLALSAATYAGLPDVIPVHFGVNGVDRWAPKTFWSWFGLPILAIGLAAVNYLVGALLATRPHLMNFPRKQRLLALPVDRQQRVMRWWWVLMQTIGLVEVLIMSVAQYGIWRAVAAQVFEGRAVTTAVLVLALAILPVTLVIIWQMSAEIERQETAGA